MRPRHLRLTAEQAESLRRHLESLVDGLEDAGPDEARHGVFVTVYRQRS